MNTLAWFLLASTRFVTIYQMDTAVEYITITHISHVNHQQWPESMGKGGPPRLLTVSRVEVWLDPSLPCKPVDLPYSGLSCHEICQARLTGLVTAFLTICS
jgi:hypothetical protein